MYQKCIYKSVYVLYIYNFLPILLDTSRVCKWEFNSGIKVVWKADWSDKNWVKFKCVFQHMLLPERVVIFYLHIPTDPPNETREMEYCICIVLMSMTWL